MHETITWHPVAAKLSERRRSKPDGTIQSFCLRCGKSVVRWAAEMRRRPRTYCSRKCHALSMAERNSSRFWKNGKRNERGCLEWQGFRNDLGYGVARHYGKRFAAHRLAWSMVNGDIPPGLLVCHACDNPSCFEPTHLFLGTHADNMADMAKKGRAARKFSKAEVEKILSMAGSSREVGEALGISARTVRYFRVRHEAGSAT